MRGQQVFSFGSEAGVVYVGVSATLRSKTQVAQKAEAQEAEQQLERREDSGGSALWFTLHQQVANR